MHAAGSVAAQATDAGSVPGTAGGIGGSPVTAGEPGLLGDETEQEGAEPMPLPVVGHGERDLGALGTDPRVHGMGDDPSVRRERDESDAVPAVHLDRVSSRRAQVDAEGHEPEGPRVGRQRAEEVVQRPSSAGARDRTCRVERSRRTTSVVVSAVCGMDAVWSTSEHPVRRMTAKHPWKATSKVRANPDYARRPRP